MPDYDDVVALTIARAPKGASLDAATVMRVAAYARKARGFQVTAEDMAGLSDAARRRLATPTANPAAPGGVDEYLRNSDEAMDVAGKQVALGVKAVSHTVGNVVGAYDDADRAYAADDLQYRAHVLSNAQNRAGGLNAAAGALVAGPSLGVGILGSATQRAVDMQDQGKDPTQLQNRINLGGTAALQSALTFSGAATGAKALNAVAGGSALGMTGARGAAAMAGTGAASALGATGAQHGLDIATDNPEFAPQGEDYAINALSAAALPAGAAAAGALRSGVRAPRPTRIVDMDTANGPTMVEPAMAPNIRGMDPMPSPTDNGVIVPGSMSPELAATAADARREVPKRSQVQRHLAEMRMKAKPDTDAAPMDGFDPEGERANQTAYDAEQQGLAKESAQNDLQAQRDLAPDYAVDAARKLGRPGEEAPSPSVFSAKYLARKAAEKEAAVPEPVVEAPVNPRKLDLPDDAQKVVDDANLTAAEFAKLRDEGLAGWDAHADPEGAAGNVKGAIDWVRKPPKKAATKPLSKDASWEEQKTHLEKTAKDILGEEDGARWLKSKSPDDITDAAGITDTTDPRWKALYQGPDWRATRDLEGDIGNIRSAKTADDLAGSAIKYARGDVQKLGVPDSIQNAFRETIEEKGISSKALEEAMMRMHLEGGNDAVTALQAVLGPDRFEAAEKRPRTFFRDDLGKLKEVTDRIDPKHYEGQTLTAYETLTPVQRKHADTKAQARRVTDRGAAINPAVAVVGAVKAVGRGIKAVAKSVPTEEIGSRWRSAREFMGDDAATRLKSSSDPEVRAVGTKFSNALGHSRDSQTRMNKSIDEATRSVSVTSKAEANELREANKPIKGANGAVSSKLYDVLSGKAPANTPLLKRIKAGFTQSNDVTQQEMKAQGVKIRANAQQGVDIVRQYLHPDADAALQGTNKVFQKALIQKIADTNVHKTGAKKGQNYTFDEVAKDFAPNGEMGNAAVRREAMEQGRKYLLPPWVEAGGEMHQVLNLDPRNYVRSTANSAAQRVGTVRAFGPDATMESIRNSILLNSAPDHRALGRALDAYSGTSKELDLNDPRKFTRLVRSAKGILSALRTTATAPLNMTEPLNMVGQVPMHHAVIGVVNAAKHRGRAVREGGMDADILNRVDLRGGAAEGVDNTAALLRRGSLTNATNRMTHAMGYEAGRSWAAGMRDAGKVSKGDAGYLEVNHIPEYIQDAFKNGHATEADVMHVAKAVGENLSGRKGSMAEAGRLSRQEMVKTWGPMFLQYGENRVRNVMRSWDAIKGAAKKGDYVTAGRLFGSRLTGTAVSAAAATAVGQVMRYGVEGLGMSLESGELKPFLGNMLGGGASDIAIRATQDDDVGNLVASLMWPIGAAADAWDVATGRKGVTDAVPAAARVRDTVEGRDVAGDKAYSLYWKAQKAQGSRSSDNPTRSGARSDIRRALMRKDYVGATAKINEYTDGLSKRDKLAFLRDSRLLPGNKEKGLTEKRRLRDEIGAAAYAYIANHDRVLDEIIAPLE